MLREQDTPASNLLWVMTEQRFRNMLKVNDEPGICGEQLCMRPAAVDASFADIHFNLVRFNLQRGALERRGVGFFKPYQ